MNRYVPAGVVLSRPQFRVSLPNLSRARESATGPNWRVLTFALRPGFVWAALVALAIALVLVLEFAPLGAHHISPLRMAPVLR